MKVIFSILFILTNLVTFPGQHKIKVKTETIKFSDGAIGKRMYTYDETGFLIKEEWATGYTVYIKNDKGDIAAQASYNKENLQEDTAYFNYDDKGNLIKQTRIYPQRRDTYVVRSVLEFDSRGNVVKETQYDKDSVLDWEYIFTFNQNNEKLTCRTIFQGEPRDDYEYEYANGKMVKKILYDRNSDDKSRNVNTTDVFFYDEKGNLLKQEVQSFDYGLNRMVNTLYTYKYNKEGNLIEMRREEEGKFSQRSTYSYIYY